MALDCFYYILTIYRRTYTHSHRSDFLQMTWQSISLSIITLTRIPFSKALTPYKHECLWDMDFNLSKCQVLHISKSRHPAQHIYMLHGQVLEAMDHAKYMYLGVDISKDLSWNTHINRISTNANRTLGFLKRNIKTKNTAICTADTKPWSALKSNTHPQYGALSLKPTLTRLK